MSIRDERSVLVEQLDELLDSVPSSGEDAVELATVAGLATRLGVDPARLESAITWRDGDGAELLAKGFREVDVDELVQAIDELPWNAEDEEVEEAVYDFDDLVAAAHWSGHTDVVQEAARRVAAMVRQIPESFAILSYDGRQMAHTRIVGQDPDLYDYWFALAEADVWAQTSS